ncbi:MAG: hypothetical protein ACFFAT_16010 [Promethearchaeota archaeon]
MEKRLDLAQKALKYLEVAEKFEESKDWGKALENYEIAFEDLRQSGYLSERINELYSRIEEIKKIISQGEKIHKEEEVESKKQLETQANSLIDGANKFESEGNLNDAVINIVSAITLLVKAGWSEQQLEHLKSKAVNLAEVIDQEKIIEKKEEISIPQTDFKIEIKPTIAKSTSSVREYEVKKKKEQETQEKAFKILDKANQLEREKNFDEAINHYKESMKLLNSIGWVEQTQNIKLIIEKIKRNREEIEEFQAQPIEIVQEQNLDESINESQYLDSNITKIREFDEKKKEEEKIQEKAFYFIDEGKRLEKEKKYDLAIKELEKAIHLLETIEWHSYIQPILNFIENIKNNQQKEIEETQKLVKKQQDLKTLQESISLKQKDEVIQTSQEISIRQREYKEKKAEKEVLESHFYSLLNDADNFLQNEGNYEAAISKYNEALELINILGPDWNMHTSTIKTSLASIQQLKKSRAERELIEKQKLEKRKKDEIEFQAQVSKQLNIERENLKKKKIALLAREDELQYNVMRKNEAFKILDTAQKYINKGEFEKAINAYQNAGLIFAEIQWLDEFPLIETSIKTLELKIKQNNLFKQEQLQKEIERLNEEKRFQKQIAKELMIEKSKQRQKEMLLKEKEEVQQHAELKRQEAFKILENAELDIRRGNYDKTIEMYRNAELILNEIQYPVIIIQEMIQKIESMKAKQEKLKEREKELKIQLKKEEANFQKQIAENNIKEKERLRQRQIITKKLEEREKILKKQKDNAFSILEEAENLLKIRKYNKALEKYRKAEILLHQMQFPTDTIKEMMTKVNTLKKQAEFEKERELQKELKRLQEEKELEAIIEERQIQEREKKLAEQLAKQERIKIAQEKASYRETAYSLLEKAKPFLKLPPPDYDAAISLYKQARTILEEHVGWEPEIKQISELILDLQQEKVKLIENQKFEEQERIKRQQEYEIFQDESRQRRAIYEKEREEQMIQYEMMLEKRRSDNEIRDEGLRLIDEGKKHAIKYDFDKAYGLYNEAKTKFKEIGWDKEVDYINAEIKSARLLEQKLKRRFEEIQEEQRELEQKRKIEDERRRREDEQKEVMVDEIGTFTDEITLIIEEKQKKQVLLEKKEQEKIAIEAKVFRKNMRAMIKFREELMAELAKAEEKEKKKQEDLERVKEMKELEDITRMIKKVAKKDEK